VLPDLKTTEQLNKFIDKLKHSISSTYAYNANEIQCGMSIGSAVYPDDGDTIDTLIKKSDLDMYSEKRKQHQN
jgi:GGDEF domain-containing protein